MDFRSENKEKLAMKYSVSSVPLVSIIILTYRNHDYIFETLDSVFRQNYPNIELIVSDDGSSEFPQEEIERYILHRKDKNIKCIKINCEKQNLGTVKHFNKALSLTSGEYIIALAGDDAFYNENVVQNYVNNFINSPDEYLIHMAQTAMYDKTLSKLQGYYCKPDIENALYTNDFSTLFDRLCLFPCLPSTSTCFKKKFFEKYGNFNETYLLIEDWPTHLRIVREKCPILYDNFIAIKHRHGGISHGGYNALSETQCKYYQDLLNIHQKEILPYIDQLSDSTRKRVRDRLMAEDLWIESTIYKSRREYKKYILFGIAHPAYNLKIFLINHWTKFRSWAQTGLLGGLGVLLVAPFINPLFETFCSEYYIRVVQRLLEITACIDVGVSCIFAVLGIIGYLCMRLETFPSDCLYIG